MSHNAVRRVIAAIGLTVPLVFFGSAVAASASSKHVTTFPGTINLSIAVPTATQDYPFYLAQDLGIFAKYGLNVNIEVVGAAAEPAALESGSLQIATETAPQNEINYYTGIPIKMIGMTTEHNLAWVTVGPQITSLKQLVGQPVGASSPTAASTLEMKWALHTAGVSPNAVTYVPVTSADSVGELLDGAVKANIFNLPEIKQAQAANPGVHTLYSFDRLPWPSGSLWGYTPWTTTHKAETVAFMRAINAALLKWETDKTDAYHEIAVHDDVTSQSTIAALYLTTIQILNRGPIALHAPNYTVQSFLQKMLRTCGFPLALQKDAREGQEWTTTYWNAAFGSGTTT